MSSEAKIYLPMNCTIEMLNNTIVGIYEIGGNKKPVGRSEIGEVVKYTKENISRANSFFEAIGILKKEGRKYILTEMGEKYAQAMSWNLDNEAKVYLSQSLLIEFLGSDLINFFTLKQEKNETKCVINSNTNLKFLIKKLNLLGKEIETVFLDIFNLVIFTPKYE